MEPTTDVECESVEIPEVRWLTVRKVAQDVLMFVWHKQEVIEVKPFPNLSFVPEITAEFLRNLSLSVWIDSYKNEGIWQKYFHNNFGRMVTTPYLFAEYVYFACDILNKDISNAYESFCATLSLVTHFVLTCWQRGRKEFLNTCVELFCQFFYNRIAIKFEEQGGWQNFNEYLIKNHEDLQICKKLMRDNKPEFEVFKKIHAEQGEHTEPYSVGGNPLETYTHGRVESLEEAVDFAESIAKKIKQLCQKKFEEILADFAETNRQVEERYRKTVGEATGETATGSEQSSLQKDKEVKTNIVEKSPLAKNQAVKESDVKKSPLPKNQAVKETDVKKSPLPKNQAVKESDVKKSPLPKNQGVKESDVKKSPLPKNQGVKTSGAKKAPVQNNQGVRSKTSKSCLASPGIQKNASKNTPETREFEHSSKLKAERAKILLQTMLDDIPKMHELIKFLCMEIPKQA